MDTLTVATIGFTKKSARTFFDLLRGSGADHLLDVRLHNVSQLAGFAKRDDLAYFLDTVLGWGYAHLPDLAPTQDILDAYQKGGRHVARFQDAYLDLLEQRRIDHYLPRATLHRACLLCSEHLPHHCHRSFLVGWLNQKWDAELHVTHLV